MKSWICMLLGLVLLVVQSNSRPNDETALENAPLPPDADNVEIHHVRLIDGVMHEDHPEIMYKEDFVNEDYDPNKQNATQSEKHGRRYKHIRRHHHRKPDADKELKIVDTEKTYFDILPETPIVIDTEVDNSNSNIQATELLKPSKEEWLVKRPKKYHSRRRRNAYYFQARSQTPYYYYYTANPPPQPNNYIGVPPAVSVIPASRYPVAGKRPNLQGPQFVDFANRDTFGADVSSNTPASSAGGLWHNSNPEDADFSLYEQERPSSSGSNANARPPIDFQVTERPVTFRPSFSVAPSVPAPDYSAASSGSLDTFLRYPEDFTYQLGSTCHRATRICCSLGYLNILYECFLRVGCVRSIAEISSACS